MGKTEKISEVKMKKIIIGLLIILLVIISCAKKEDIEKARRGIKQKEVQSSPCFVTEIDGCEYIYCYYYYDSDYHRLAIAITPKLNQKNPERCNYTERPRPYGGFN
jgi:hypothetical protein